MTTIYLVIADFGAKGEVVLHAHRLAEYAESFVEQIKRWEWSYLPFDKNPQDKPMVMDIKKHPSNIVASIGRLAYHYRVDAVEFTE